GIFNAAKALDLPVIIGTAEGERSFIGTKQAVALVKSLREEFNYPIFLNADHTYSFDKVKEAIDAVFIHIETRNKIAFSYGFRRFYNFFAIKSII
ncbi:class II fructose-bisphosphate aldolase, partial [uncultured Thiodictyon sp.]|uniref:class II fructose-bisphosphate aldolase n=1 Tax=uncultured Thiodictyon sp. TaxID=1846217 RepID=UPI0025D13EC6